MKEDVSGNRVNSDMPPLMVWKSGTYCADHPYVQRPVNVDNYDEISTKTRCYFSEYIKKKRKNVGLGTR